METTLINRFGQSMAVTCAVMVILTTNARADFGPKTIHQSRVNVTLDGKPISDDAIAKPREPTRAGVNEGIAR